MPRYYQHRFKKYGYQCQECFGAGINESYAEKLCARDSRFYSFQPRALMCEICAGNGWLTGKDFKDTFGESPAKLGVRASLVIE